jgi:hypothetical protein
MSTHVIWFKKEVNHDISNAKMMTNGQSEQERNHQ